MIGEEIRDTTTDAARAARPPIFLGIRGTGSQRSTTGIRGQGRITGRSPSQTMAGTGGAAYQNECWGTFSYNFAVPNGSYRVRLKFAELYFNAANQRKFHVDLNGTRVLNAFDVFAAAGGQNQSVDREFPVTVTNGQVQLAFTPVVDNAKVNAIEIVGAPGSGFTPIRVIAGGGAVTDARGVVWSADTGYSGGYTYSTGSTINGEVVNYSYDALGRIAAAQIGGTAGWGFAYAFDGWGNRTEQRQTKTGLSSTLLSYSAASNRISSAGYGYDSNGNMTQINAPVSMTLTYDQENRLVTTSAGEQYGYAPDNKRVWKSAGGSEWLYFWLGDRMLTRYSVAAGTYALTAEKVEKYFGGRNLSIQPDRLESDVAAGRRYHPFGEEVAPSANEAWKFGTYWREGNGLDYADQRWYASGVGRFLTADPYVASGGVGSPGSWNRYAFVEGDPGNFNDPTGLDSAMVSGNCGNIAVYNSQMTGPPGGCNTIAVTAWSNGIESWTQAPTAGLSQIGSIQNVDQAAIHATAWARYVGGLWWGPQVMADCGPTPGENCLKRWQAIGASMIGFEGGSYLITPPSSSVTPPATGAALAPRLAPSPTKPVCPLGQHPNRWLNGCEPYPPQCPLGFHPNSTNTGCEPNDIDNRPTRQGGRRAPNEGMRGDDGASWRMLGGYAQGRMPLDVKAPDSRFHV